MNHPPILVYAHRGASAHLPENTIDAFEVALRDGANALELDVHPTLDGELVVSHDSHGHRTAGVDTAIAEVTTQQLATWRMNAPDGRPTTSTMPSLRAVLETFPGVPMSVDLKVPDRDAADLLVHLVQTHQAEHHVTLASFHESVMRHIHALGYPGPTALTRREVAALRLLPRSLARRLIRGSAAQIPRIAGMIRLDRPGFVRRCRRLGLRVDYWVVNDPADAIRLLDRGATGVMTDDPTRVARPVWEWCDLNQPPARPRHTDKPLQSTRTQGGHRD